LEDQNEPSSTPLWETAKANASARRMAVAGSSQPSTGDHRNVEGTRPIPWGLNTCAGPWLARAAAVRAKTSGLVVVEITGPG
jgi:hypothetical protein